MTIIHRRITIIQMRQPANQGLNEELQYLANSLGLLGLRDKDNSCFRIFIELLKGARKNIAFSSDELALRTDLSRGTVVHHLGKLMEAGLVVPEHSKYILRAGNLEAVLDEVQKDINRSLNDLRRIAHEIDLNLGMQ